VALQGSFKARSGFLSHFNGQQRLNGRQGAQSLHVASESTFTLLQSVFTDPNTVGRIHRFPVLVEVHLQPRRCGLIHQQLLNNGTIRLRP